MKSDAFTLYYASDIHGSELLWRKFINAGQFYDADVLVMGGDLTGKGIVPITPAARGRWEATFLGRRVTVRNERKLVELEDDILFNGMYPYRCETAEAIALADDEPAQDELFERLAQETIGRWMTLADERLPGDSEHCYVMPGNDDVWSIDEAFDGHRMHNCDQRVVDLGGGYSMLSLGYANRTPWTARASSTRRSSKEGSTLSRLRCRTCGGRSSTSTCPRTRRSSTPRPSSTTRSRRCSRAASRC